jgi:hypothetical protein
MELGEFLMLSMGMKNNLVTLTLLLQIKSMMEPGLIQDALNGD